MVDEPDILSVPPEIIRRIRLQRIGRETLERCVRLLLLVGVASILWAAWESKWSAVGWTLACAIGGFVSLLVLLILPNAVLSAAHSENIQYHMGLAQEVGSSFHTNFATRLHACMAAFLDAAVQAAVSAIVFYFVWHKAEEFAHVGNWQRAAAATSASIAPYYLFYASQKIITFRQLTGLTQTFAGALILAASVLISFSPSIAVALLCVPYIVGAIFESKKAIYWITYAHIPGLLQPCP